MRSTVLAFVFACSTGLSGHAFAQGQDEVEHGFVARLAERLSAEQREHLAGLEEKLRALDANLLESIPLRLEIGSACEEAGAFLEAEQVYLGALAVEGVETDSIYLSVRHLLGTAALGQRDYAKAELHYRIAFDRIREQVGPEHVAHAMSATDVARALIDLDRHAEAEALLIPALATLRERTGATSELTARASVVLARLYLAQQKVRHAEATLEWLIGYFESAGTAQEQAPLRRALADTQLRLGSLYRSVGLLSRARPLLEQSYAAARDTFDTDDTGREYLLVNLAAYYDVAGDADTARNHFREAGRVHKVNTGYAFRPGTPLPRPIPDVLPDPKRTGVLSDARVGDWMVVGKDGAPLERAAIVDSSPVAVVLGSSSGEVVWQRAVDAHQFCSLPADAALTPREVHVGSETLHGWQATFTNQQGDRITLQAAPDVVPLGGVVRYLVNGELSYEILEYGRGSTQVEAVVFPFDTERFKLGHQITGLEAIREFVPIGQTVRDWTEMITLQTMDRRALGLPPLRTMLEQQHQHLVAQCPGRCGGPIENIIAEEPHSLTYEWRIEGCDGMPDQHEIGKWLESEATTFRIAYVRKVSRLNPEEREDWVQAVAQAKIVTSTGE